MRDKSYYSIRTGKNPHASSYNLKVLGRLFVELYTEYVDKGYFQEALGYDCVDAGHVLGKLGNHVGRHLFRKLRKDNLWPIEDRWESYSEDDLFDMIEFLHDLVSKPLTGRYHDYASCGYHYSTFDQEAGRKEFREEVNKLLKDYLEGFELSTTGEVWALPGHGLAGLLEIDANTSTEELGNIQDKVRTAVSKFRRHHSSLDDRRSAIRDLADVLELQRNDLKGLILAKDDNDLFQIVNRFGIRHNRVDQKVDYDKEIWYEWLFYYYLAAVHGTTKLIAKSRLSNLVDNFGQVIGLSDRLVVYVSTGGTCRCAMANIITRNYLDRQFPGTCVRPISASYDQPTSERISDGAVAVLQNRIIPSALVRDIREHKSIQADASYWQRADLILAMESKLQTLIARKAGAKALLFSEFFGGTGDIEDPYAIRSISAYEKCFNDLDSLISAGISRLVKRLVPEADVDAGTDQV